MVILPSDHRLAGKPEVDPSDLEGETFVGFSDVPHVLQNVVETYIKKCGVDVTPSHHIDNFAMGISLVASTRGVALLPAYVEPLLPWSVVSRQLQGEPPHIELAIGYRADNPSPVLKKIPKRSRQAHLGRPRGDQEQGESLNDDWLRFNRERAVVTPWQP